MNITQLLSGKTFKVIALLIIAGSTTYFIKKSNNPYGLPKVKIEEPTALSPDLNPQERAAILTERYTGSLNKVIDRIDHSKAFKEQNIEIIILRDLLNRILEVNQEFGKNINESKELLPNKYIKEDTRKTFNDRLENILKGNNTDIMLSDKILNEALFKMNDKEKLAFLEHKLEKVKENNSKVYQINQSLKRLITGRQMTERLKNL